MKNKFGTPGNPAENTQAKAEMMEKTVEPMLKSHGFKRVSKRMDVFTNGNCNLILRAGPTKSGERKYCLGMLKELYERTENKSYIVYLRERVDLFESETYKNHYFQVRRLNGKQNCLGTVMGLSNLISDIELLKSGERY